jgi:hypothetical protein
MPVSPDRRDTHRFEREGYDRGEVILIILSLEKYLHTRLGKSPINASHDMMDPEYRMIHASDTIVLTTIQSSWKSE